MDRSIMRQCARPLTWLLPLLLLSACAGTPNDPAFRAAADGEIARRPGIYANGGARAWQVGKDGTMRGLIWGTLHVGYGDDTVLPAQIRDRFYQATDLTVEVVLDRALPAVRAMAAVYARANTAYDAAAFERLDEPARRALADVPGTRDHTLSLRGLAARVLAAPAQSAFDPAALPSIGFVDLNLISFARQQNRPVRGLEHPTIIDPTVADPNGPDASAMVGMALRRRATNQDFSRWLRAAYHDGDVAGLMAAMTAWQAEPDDIRRSDINREALLTRRNAAWLPQLDRLFTRPGDHFVAVGAGHLPGSDGLVTLLRSRGYEVVPCVHDVCPRP